MTYFNKEYLITHVNKVITLIFTVLFIINFIIFFNGITPVTVYATIALLVFNALNLRDSKKISAFFEALIYEIIALLGIYFINWIYALVFVLVAKVIGRLKRRIILTAVIVINSTLYLLIYFHLARNGITRDLGFGGIILFLLLTILGSIYFVNSEEEDDDKKVVYEAEILNIEQKYQELLTEHKNVLVLKEIMDLANVNMDLNSMIIKINELLMKNYDNIDYSTIFLYDESRKQLKIISTNVQSQYHRSLCNLDQFDDFEDVIKNTHGKIISSELGLRYPTAIQREICAALCVPLHTNKSLIGVILLESYDPQAFKNIDLNQFNLVRYNISLIIENKKWINKIEKMALVDGLTGVYNRHYLFDFLSEQLKWHKSNGKRLCLILFDIDHFKKFNDTYGHLFGDLVLKEICNLVKNSIREEDLIARYGGEEFIIILVDTDKEIARERIEQIRIKIQDHVVKNEEGIEAKVTVSFGIAEFSEISYNITMEELIKRADLALYRSKEEGRNRVTIYNSDDEVGL